MKKITMYSGDPCPFCAAAKALLKTKDDNWIIWAGWADRITFEEIREKTGKNESDVIKIMRKNLKPSSFRSEEHTSELQSILIN